MRFGAAATRWLQQHHHKADWGDFNNAHNGALTAPYLGEPTMTAPDPIGAWLDARIQTAIATAAPALMSALLDREPELIAPLLKYLDLDNRIAQLEQVLPQILGDALHIWKPHLLLPGDTPPEETP